MKRLAALGLAIMLTACRSVGDTPAPAPLLESPAQASVVQSECAIYYAVNAQRVDQRLPVIASLTRGCPAGTDSIAADIDARPGAQIDTPLASTIRQRMIARGMPTATAAAVATSAAFEALVLESAAL